MAIAVSSERKTNLTYAANVTIGDLSAAGPLQNVGYAIAMFIRAGSVLTSYGSSVFNVIGQGAAGATWNGWRVGLRSSGATDPRKLSSFLHSGVNAAWSGGERVLAALPSLIDGQTGTDGFVFAHGVRNVGTVLAPDWRVFAAMCAVGSGTGTEYQEAVANAAHITVSKPVLGDIFDNAGSARPPIGLGLKNVAVMRGNITLAMVEDWAEGLATYATTPGITVIDHRRLNNPTDLLDIGPSGPGTALAVNALDGDNVVDQAWPDIGAWLASENINITTSWQAPFEVIGGRGVYSLPVSGGSAGVTGVERRWVNHATGTPLAGALGTWTATTFDSGTGNWSFSDTLPWSGAGNTEYRLELRNPTATVTVSQAGLYIGTNIALVGQSGLQLIFAAADGFGTNQSGTVVAAGAVGQMVTLNDQEAGAPGAYVQPTMLRRNMTGGATPTVNQGTVAFLNEWHAAGGGPLRITQSAIQGTGAGATIADDPYEGWQFRGTIGVPAPTATGNSGGVGFHGFMVHESRRVADAYLLMWFPGIGGTRSEAETNTPGLWTVLDPMWNVKVPLKIICPPYRISRPPSDYSYLNFRREVPQEWAVANDAIVASGAASAFLVPQIVDVFMGDPSNGAHPSNLLTETDANGGSVRRIGATYGRAAAAAFSDGSIERMGPTAVAAWLEAGGAQMVIEFGKRLTTLAGAAPSPRSFFVSEDNGSTWTRGLSVGSPFTAAIEGTRVRLTRATGTWSATNLRVAVNREDWPHKDDGLVGQPFVNEPAYSDSEAHQRGALNGMIYQADGAGWRFGASGAQPGWPICTVDYNGIPVAAAKPAPALVMRHPLPAGAKTIQVRAFGTGLPPGGELITLPNPATVL